MVMREQRSIESLVGTFVLLAIISLIVLAFKVSGLTNLFPHKSYLVQAAFDDIGGLKVKAPIKIGGVQVGTVDKIDLDSDTFRAIVTMRIYQQFHDIPDDSSAGIFTAGLLGDNYITITPMYNKTYLKEGSHIEITNSAMVLEKLIGQLIYKLGNGNNNNETGDNYANKQENKQASS
jgi:phospholipid/cholesterol/gamma-HCH transport system substrate-binding protein